MLHDDNRTSSTDAGDAVEYNQRVLRDLEGALAREPDLDLLLARPCRYQSKLTWKKQEAQALERCTASSASKSTKPLVSLQTPTLQIIDVSSRASALYPSSITVKSMLGNEESLWVREQQLLDGCGKLEFLRSATVLFRSNTDDRHLVARCKDDIAGEGITIADC